MVVSCCSWVHLGNTRCLHVYLSIQCIYLTVIRNHSWYHLRKSRHGAHLSITFPPGALVDLLRWRASAAKAWPREPAQCLRRQSRLVWIRELWTAEQRMDLREALCQKPGQKNKMKHSSGPAGLKQLLVNICTFGSKIIVSLLMHYFYFFFNPVWM